MSFDPNYYDNTYDLEAALDARIAALEADLMRVEAEALVEIVDQQLDTLGVPEGARDHVVQLAVMQGVANGSNTLDVGNAYEEYRQSALDAGVDVLHEDVPERPPELPDDMPARHRLAAVLQQDADAEVVAEREQRQEHGYDLETREGRAEYIGDQVAEIEASVSEPSPLEAGP